MESTKTRFFRRVDLLVLLSAVVSLLLAVDGDPWWRVTGATNSNLLTMEVSPYYFQTIATGISSGTNLVAYLGPLTRLLLILGFAALRGSLRK